jgi:hypothetical protein
MKTFTIHITFSKGNQLIFYNVQASTEEEAIQLVVKLIKGKQIYKISAEEDKKVLEV